MKSLNGIQINMSKNSKLNYLGWRCPLPILNSYKYEACDFNWWTFIWLSSYILKLVLHFCSPQWFTIKQQDYPGTHLHRTAGAAVILLILDDSAVDIVDNAYISVCIRIARFAFIHQFIINCKWLAVTKKPQRFVRASY